MDPSFVVFILGSFVSFVAFYWAFNRWSPASRSGRHSNRAKLYGLQKRNFLDDLRHEAGLRAQAAIGVAVDQLNRRAKQTAYPTIDAELMERLRETRSMLQSLLPRECTAEFDHIVRLLHAPPSVRRVELDAAIERLSRLTVGGARGPRYAPALGQSFGRMRSLPASSEAT